MLFGQRLCNFFQLPYIMRTITLVLTSTVYGLNLESGTEIDIFLYREKPIPVLLVNTIVIRNRSFMDSYC